MANNIILAPVITKNISDKLYERRKIAALEVETLVNQLIKENNLTGVYNLISILTQRYALSTQANAKKGGLLCLAACAVGLSGSGHPEVSSPQFLETILPPILQQATTDVDARVRYYAIESLYNVIKSTRLGLLHVFPQVFDALFKLCSDTDASVQNAAAFLDNLVKDVVAESETFDFSAFLPELQKSLAVDDPRKRSFLLGWISLLDSLPSAEPALLRELPRLLPGVLTMLSDSTPEVRQAAVKLVGELRTSASGVFESGELASVLVAQLGCHYLNGSSSSGEGGGGGGGEENGTGGTAEGTGGSNGVSSSAAAELLSLEWLTDIVQNSTTTRGQQGTLGAQLPLILRATLPCLGSQDSAIVEAAWELNAALVDYVQNQQQKPQVYSNGETSVDKTETQFYDERRVKRSLDLAPATIRTQQGYNALDMPALITAAATGLDQDSEICRLESLRWMNTLLSSNRQHQQHTTTTSTTDSSVNITELVDIHNLLNTLCEALSVTSSDRVIQEASSVLAAVARQGQQGQHGNDQFFITVMSVVLTCFKGPAGMKLLQRRGSVILRCLCQELGGESVLRALAQQLSGSSSGAGDESVHEAKANTVVKGDKDEDDGSKENDMTFAALVVQALNLVLVTAPELQDTRYVLQRTLSRNTTTTNNNNAAAAGELFTCLFKAFSYSAGATLSLCLLGQCFDLAWEVVQALASPPLSCRIAYNVVELSQLVSMLEAPSFASLRLQLLSSEDHPMLLRCLYGVLMVLPQGDAFRTLQTRLSCLPPVCLQSLRLSESTSSRAHTDKEGDNAVDDKALIQIFRVNQLRLVQ